MNHQSNMFINLKLPLHAFQLISLRLLLCYTAHEKLENNVLPHNQPTDTNKEVRLRFFFHPILSSHSFQNLALRRKRMFREVTVMMELLDIPVAELRKVLGFGPICI